MPTLSVVGSINMDIVAFVARHPRPGETILGERSAQLPGGKGANQAVAAARLRADPKTVVRMVGRVGRDAFGSEMVRFLEGEGIDVAEVVATEAAGTGLALITVDARGENAITVISGANMAWLDGLPTQPFASRDIVICQLEIPLAIVEAAFVQAKVAKATTILNPAPYQSLPDAILSRTDILVLNEIELGQMLGRDAAEIADDKQTIPAAREVLAKGPGAVIVTLGAAGVLLVERGGRAERVPGHAVRAVDTTGAGDCFVGALAAQMLVNDDLLAAAHFANRAAAVSVTRAGAAASIPTRQELVITP